MHCSHCAIVCLHRKRERGETIDSSRQSHPALTPPNHTATSLEARAGESVRKLLSPFGAFDLWSCPPFSWSCKRFQRGGCFPTMHSELRGFTPLLPTSLPPSDSRSNLILLSSYISIDTHSKHCLYKLLMLPSDVWQALGFRPHQVGFTLACQASFILLLPYLNLKSFLGVQASWPLTRNCEGHQKTPYRFEWKDKRIYGIPHLMWKLFWGLMPAGHTGPCPPTCTRGGAFSI